MAPSFSRQLADCVERLKGLAAAEDANSVQQAMDEAEILFHEMKSIGETLTAAYHDIVGLKPPRSPKR